MLDRQDAHLATARRQRRHDAAACSLQHVTQLVLGRLDHLGPRPGPVGQLLPEEGVHRLTAVLPFGLPALALGLVAVLLPLAPRFVVQLTGDRVESMRRGLTSAADRAELPVRWRPHDLRHRRVTTWLAEGKSPVKVKAAVGHADLQTTMHYYRYAKGHLRSLVEDTSEADLDRKLDRVMGMLKQVVGEAAEGDSAAGQAG